MASVIGPSHSVAQVLWEQDGVNHTDVDAGWNLKEVGCQQLRSLQITGEEAAKEKNHHSHVNRPPVHSKPFVFIFSLLKKMEMGKEVTSSFMGLK